MMESSVKTTRIYEKVVEKLKEEIADGRLLPGDPLPSERQLMETFGVSRSSLREAFRVMELLGLIESIAGKGRFVRQPREIAEDQRKGIQLEDSAILELMEARRILDPAIAGESAMRATPSDLMRLLRVITATEEHLALPRDRAFVNITRMNFDLILATHERIYNLLDDKGAFLNEHREMYDAILDHDAERAREAASRHIDRIYRTLHRGIAAGI